jgi:hypothetical protein
MIATLTDYQRRIRTTCKREGALRAGPDHCLHDGRCCWCSYEAAEIIGEGRSDLWSAQAPAPGGGG